MQQAAHATCFMDILSLILPLVPAKWSPSMATDAIALPLPPVWMLATLYGSWTYLLWWGVGVCKWSCKWIQILSRFSCYVTEHLMYIKRISLSLSLSPPPPPFPPSPPSLILSLTHFVLANKLPVYLCVRHCWVYIPVVHTCLSSKSWLMKQAWNAAA